MAKKRKNPVATTARAVSGASARYDAAGHGKRLVGWSAPSSGPNRAQAGLETLRNRSRDATRNEWAAAASERIWGTNLIGTGIIARPNTKDPALKQLYTDIWNDFCATADADGVLDFYGLQTLAVEAWRSSGEVFIRFRPRRADDGLRVPLQIQLLEADMVPLIDYDSFPGLPPGNRIRQGIELDRIGRRVAYWCYREHPGDSVTRGVSHSDLSRVPAKEMRHLFKPARPGALRGVPANAPVLPKLRSVGNFDDAVLHRQELANLFTMFITQAAPEPPLGAPGDEPGTAQQPRTVGLRPGQVYALEPGDDVKFSEPPDAGANYPDFMRQQHLGVASGGGTPYELMTGDVRDVSDRTLRIIINEFRRTCEQYQWQLIIPMLCQPVREACAEAAILAGLLTPKQGVGFPRCVWSPHAWPYIHPTQDVQAKKMERDAGFKSRAAIVAERGDDVEQVDAERADDASRERRLKIVLPAPPQSDA